MEPNVCFLSLTKRWEPLETCAKTLSSDGETLEEPPPTIKFHKRSYIPGLSGVPLLDKVTHETSTGCGLLVSAVTWYLGLLSNLLQSYLQVARIYRRNPIQKNAVAGWNTERARVYDGFAARLTFQGHVSFVFCRVRGVPGFAWAFAS